jgi:hypothetical protein
MAELEAGLDEIRRAPKDEGVLELIVRRPRKGEREVLEEGALDLRDGLVGDSWKDRRSARSADGRAHPDMQINVMGSAMIEVTSQPHTGCGQFVERFGLDAMKFVNSPLGQQLQLRGINARVVRPGVIRVGDVAKKA